MRGDVTRIFYRESEFARRHNYNGTEILCIVDAEDAQKSRNLNAVSIEWDTGAHIMTLRIPTDELCDEPLEGERVLFDGQYYVVEAVSDNEGEWILTLKSSEARSIV